MMVCFLCGRPGHGDNRCSRVDTSFPFLPQGWSVDIRNGQYQAVSAGKRGMVRAGGSASRIIGDCGGERASPVARSQLIWGLPVGHVHGPGWSSSTQAFPLLGSHLPVVPSGIHGRDKRRMPVLAQPVLGQRDRVVSDSPIGMGGSSIVGPPQYPELSDMGGGCGLQGEIVGLRRI